jgi:RND superfamily putative drug exporter
MSAPEDATTAIPAQRAQNGTDEVSPAISAEETRAIPVSRPDQGDSEVATEKLNSRGKKEGEERQRRGGGVSAQDLLRREGRL